MLPHFSYVFINIIFFSSHSTVLHSTMEVTLENSPVYS